MNKRNTRLWMIVLLAVAAAAIVLTTYTDRSSTPRKATTTQVKRPKLVELGAAQCKTCLKLAPILDALREEYRGRLDVVFINVWKDKKAAKPYDFRVIPTQILYDAQGNEVWRHEGFISKDDLETVFAEKVHVGRSA